MTNEEAIDADVNEDTDDDTDDDTDEAAPTAPIPEARGESVSPAPTPEARGESVLPTETSCLRFPDNLTRVLGAVAQYDLMTLRDVFGSRLAMTDTQLLQTPVLPEECQLRTTVYLLRRSYSLLEAAKENTETGQLVIGVAQECTPFQYKGRRS